MPPLMNAPTFPCSGASLGLLFRQLRDAMWARMKLELANLGHDLTFSQYVTLKKLATGTAGVTDLARAAEVNPGAMTRSEEHTSELQSLMRISYAVFCLKKKTKNTYKQAYNYSHNNNNSITTHIT